MLIFPPVPVGTLPVSQALTLDFPLEFYVSYWIYTDATDKREDRIHGA